MTQENPINKYDLVLVKARLSDWLAILTYLFFIGLAVVTAIVHIKTNPSNAIIIAFSIFALSTTLIVIFREKFNIKYKSSISIYDDCFYVDAKKYYYYQVEWYRSDHGGGHYLAFDIGIYGEKQPIKLFAEVKSMKNLNFRTFIEMRKAILYGIKSIGIQTRSYYDTKFYRRLARTIFTSNLVLLAVLLALEVSINRALPIFLAWAFISLPYPIVIFMKQDVEVYRD